MAANRIMLETLRDILIANELGGDLSLVYRFSDADGVRTGKAGYSFGVCQFDLRNNINALRCLADCRFTGIEIARLVLQDLYGGELAHLETKLAGQRPMVDGWDTQEMLHTTEHVRRVLRAAGLKTAGPAALYHLMDYHNQYYLAANGKCVRHMATLGRAISAEDVREYKLTTLWGKKRPDDVARRFQNIAGIVAGREPATPGRSL